MRKIKYALLAILTLISFASCKQDAFEEITGLELSRCLQPMGLNARVNSTLGDVVTFSWDVTKDADSYQLVVYTDKAMTSEYLSETLAPSAVPYQKKLDADKTYYFTVQAFSDKKEPSKVAVYEKSFKTFAVKDNLYLKVASRTAASVSLAWSKEVEDFAEVDRIEYALPGGDALGAHTLTAEEIASMQTWLEQHNIL